MSSTKTQSKFVKLIMVSSDNRNKYYEMTYNGGSTFTVKYGRVESTSTTASYPISMWDSKYNEKVKKGYKDVTAFVAIDLTKVTKSEFKNALVGIPLVDEFLESMQRYTNNLVSNTYSVKAEAVTQAQLDAAQALLDQLNGKGKKLTTDKEVNDVLIALYTTIPRRMSKVNEHLLPQIALKDILEDEQDNLDAMASQVALTNPKPSKTPKKKEEKKTLLDLMGASMDIAKNTKELKYLLDQMPKNIKIKGIFEVNKPTEDADFEEWKSTRKNKTTKLLIHGTKCTSVIPILEIGLKIRPKGNFQFSGKAYGNGNYFSEVVQKSLGYTGWDKDKILLVYEVHTGNPFVYDGWYRGNSFPLTLKDLTDRGFDSTHVNAGNGLLNSEIIAYSEKQNRIKYILWLQ